MQFRHHIINHPEQFGTLQASWCCTAHAAEIVSILFPLSHPPPVAWRNGAMYKELCKHMAKYAVLATSGVHSWFTVGLRWDVKKKKKPTVQSILRGKMKEPPLQTCDRQWQRHILKQLFTVLCIMFPHDVFRQCIVGPSSGTLPGFLPWDTLARVDEWCSSCTYFILLMLLASNGCNWLMSLEEK